MKTRYWVVAGIIALSAIAIYYFSNSVLPYHKTSSSPTLYGNVDIRSVNLSFRVGGRLANLTVDEGDSVQKGQPLGHIDDEPYRIARQQALAQVNAAQAALDLLLAGSRQEEIDQAKAQVAQFEAAYRYANTTYERQRKLSISKSISADQLDNVKTERDRALANLRHAKEQLTLLQNGARPQELQRARAQVAQAQAALSKAELDLVDTKLTAPSKGVVKVRAIEPGTLLNAGTPVFTVALTEPVWVRAYIDEIHLAEASPGRQINIYTDARPNQPYHGRIGFVSPTAEFTPKTVETEVLRTSLVYRLRIIVDDPDNALRQGMPVTLTFLSDHKSE